MIKVGQLWRRFSSETCSVSEATIGGLVWEARGLGLGHGDILRRRGLSPGSPRACRLARPHVQPRPRLPAHRCLYFPGRHLPPPPPASPPAVRPGPAQSHKAMGEGRGYTPRGATDSVRLADAGPRGAGTGLGPEGPGPRGTICEVGECEWQGREHSPMTQSQPRVQALGDGARRGGGSESTARARWLETPAAVADGRGSPDRWALVGRPARGWRRRH